LLFTVDSPAPLTAQIQLYVIIIIRTSPI